MHKHTNILDTYQACRRKYTLHKHHRRTDRRTDKHTNTPYKQHTQHTQKQHTQHIQHIHTTHKDEGAATARPCARRRSGRRAPAARGCWALHPRPRSPSSRDWRAQRAQAAVTLQQVEGAAAARGGRTVEHEGARGRRRAQAVAGADARRHRARGGAPCPVARSAAGRPAAPSPPLAVLSAAPPPPGSP